VYLNLKELKRLNAQYRLDPNGEPSGHEDIDLSDAVDGKGGAVLNYQHLQSRDDSHAQPFAATGMSQCGSQFMA